MSKTTTQAEINAAIWKACDTFRGVVDPSDYKNYVLIMLFLKYISDVAKDRLAELKSRYGDNQAMIERQMGRSRFVLPERSSFDELFARRHETNIGELIDRALEAIEDENSAKLHDVFRNVSFDSPTLGQKRDANSRLRRLLEDYAGLDLRPSRVSGDIIGNAYMYLIERFASDAGKKGGEFYTPHGVSVLLAKLLRARPGDRICDPACGSGSLLIEVGKEVGSRDYSLYGQESNGGTWALCRLNMFLHDEDSADIQWGNTLTNPLLVEHGQLMRFNVVVANPPFSLDKWGQEEVADDPYNRFRRGLPPKSKADYAFISHMVETALPGEGRVGVVAPHGVLFRGGAEGKIRQRLIDDNLLDAVIGLPVNLFFGTGIPAAILLFDRTREQGGANRDRKDVLFIDASREFLSGKSQNYLREEDIARIAETYHDRREEARYSRRVPLTEIEEHGYNLNIARYIDTSEEPEEVDLAALQREIDGLEAELATVRGELTAQLRELEVI
jgi:type I restriction enzyme M protein